MSSFYKYPRLFTPLERSIFKTGEKVFLSHAQAHYLFHVLRRSAGDRVRLFNGKNGEYLAQIIEINKKRVTLILEECLKEQSSVSVKIHLLFAPIKKSRMDVLIEKVVELGVTDLHPVITQRTENRKFNEERVQAQIIEAAEQCERLDIPVLHGAESFIQKIEGWSFESQGHIFAAIERLEAAGLLALAPQSCEHNVWAFLVGPEGGFTPEELLFLERCIYVEPVSLGERVLRTETAAFLCVGFASTFSSSLPSVSSSISKS